MIQKSECFLLGTFVRVQKHKGALVLQLDTDHPDHYSGITSLLVELNEQLIPYIISSISIRDQIAIVQLENLNNDEQVDALIGADVYLPLTELPVLTGNHFYYHEIIGFVLTDAIFGEVGIISQLYDMPKHTVAQVYHHNKEVLIPLHSDFIVLIDRDKKTLMMKLPEGLVGIYL